MLNALALDGRSRAEYNETASNRLLTPTASAAGLTESQPAIVQCDSPCWQLSLPEPDMPYGCCQAAPDARAPKVGEHWWQSQAFLAACGCATRMSTASAPVGPPCRPSRARDRALVRGACFAGGVSSVQFQQERAVDLGRTPCLLLDQPVSVAPGLEHLWISQSVLGSHGGVYHRRQ